MTNLAGVDSVKATAVCREELRRCRIDVVDIDLGHPEVFVTIGGKLGNFTFRRQWYYWSVSGQVPLEIAEQLYADPAGVVDIRCGGSCVCPSPRSQAIWIAPCGKRVLASEEEKECLHYALMPADSTSLVAICKKILNENLFCDDPSNYPGVRGFVDGYHIDTEVGLRVFADAIRHLK